MEVLPVLSFKTTVGTVYGVWNKYTTAERDDNVTVTLGRFIHKDQRESTRRNKDERESTIRKKENKRIEVSRVCSAITVWVASPWLPETRPLGRRLSRRIAPQAPGTSPPFARRRPLSAARRSTARARTDRERGSPRRRPPHAPRHGR